MLYFAKLPRSPQWMDLYQIWFCGSSRGRNQLCGILLQSAHGFRFCEGSKFAISHWLGRSPLTQCWRYHAACDNQIRRNQRRAADDVNNDEMWWLVHLNSSWEQSWAVWSQSLFSVKDWSKTWNDPVSWYSYIWLWHPLKLIIWTQIKNLI